MKKIELREDYIKSLPLTTNRITVDWSVDKFFNRYSIISYYTNDPKFKNLAYEQLGDVPSISVSGIFAAQDPGTVLPLFTGCVQLFRAERNGAALQHCRNAGGQTHLHRDHG